MTEQEYKDLKEILVISAPVACQLVNAAPSFHENEAIQALALMGASVAITKEGSAGVVSRTQFLEAAALIWDTIQAEFETVPVISH